jgi:hypothetical protein
MARAKPKLLCNRGQLYTPQPPTPKNSIFNYYLHYNYNYDYILILYSIFDVLTAIYLFQTSNAARIALFMPRYQIPSLEPRESLITEVEAFTSYTPVRTPKFCDFFKVLGKC